MSLGFQLELSQILRIIRPSHICDPIIYHIDVLSMSMNKV